MFVNQEEKEATDQELENLNRHFQAVKQQFDWVQKEENSPENMDEQSKMQDSVAHQENDPVNERSFILFSHNYIIILMRMLIIIKNVIIIIVIITVYM